jgi:tetratricopeptide (TPR) repeat protein
MKTEYPRFALSAICLLCPLFFARPLRAADAVTVHEEQVTIPTYVVGDPDPNPQFYFGDNSQGAQHRIYPYPMYDDLTAVKDDNKKYKMVYLENEYVKIGILPDSGGKIFEAIDKTNGYNFFYRQHVIKPALISLLGAWISGGVEWNIPHHHRATSFLPMQYTVRNNPDGSKTVWVGELELRDRMLWTVGMTLHPGKSYLEASFRILNRTPVQTSMLCFSNAAVSVNDAYQVIFPPDVQHVTFHAKREFTTWPIATNHFASADFGAGVDASWWKAHSTSMSMFAWNCNEDFLAGYDHGKNAGTMAIADHNVVPGKKFWTWGNGPAGQNENRQLTDADGPYIELMVGAYSDNQPDYSWLAPYETRGWTQYWYPFRDIDGVKNANIDAAVNLDVTAGKAKLGFHTTADRTPAIATLTLKGKIILQEEISIDPGKPYVKQIDLPAGADEHDLRASLSADGKELIAYSPIKLIPEPMPDPVTPWPAPADIKTNEELYLAGMRIDQFHTPGNVTADPYWLEALKRDPGDVRVNTALGIEKYNAGLYADAETYLRKALERATFKYTSPQDGEPFYYLGLALKAQGKTDEAFAQFAKATWSAAWTGPGYFEKAQIDTARGDLALALADIDHALDANAQNIRALDLKAALLRLDHRPDEARAALAAAQKIDPLDVRAMAELWLLDKTSLDRSVQSQSDESFKPLAAAVFQFPATGQEIAAEYLNAGLFQDGQTVMSELVAAGITEQGRSQYSALDYYYLGYFEQKLNHPDKAAADFQLAAAAPTDLVFPFQMEMVPVLEAAMKNNPSDNHAPYYLGNLLFDWQPDRATALWEKSASMGADFPVVYRNLALVYTRAGNQRDKALANLEKASSFGGNGMVYNDLDKLYEENGVSPEKRLALLEAHQAVINRDDVIAREINLDVFAGKYDDAVALMKTRFFRAWEGAGGRFSLADTWVDINLLKGRQMLATKQYNDALADFQAAMTMPENLIEAGGSTAGRKIEDAYWMAIAYEAMGDSTKAAQAWADITAPPPANPPGRGGRGGAAARADGGSGNGFAAGVRVTDASLYYQALAYQKLGNPDRANALFQQLIDTGTKNLSGSTDLDTLTKSNAPSAQRIRVADAHYLIGLGQLGLGNKDKATEEFTTALQASPDHLAAKVALQSLGDGK